MALSVVSPIDPAIARTRAILFQPFNAEKWFKLGFCAFLTSLGGGNCGGNFNGPINRVAQRFEDGGDFEREYLALILIVGAILLAVGLSLWVLVLWLQSRGHFMFLDGVVRDRGAVKEPWSTYRAQGNSLFRFTLGLQLAFMVLLAGAVALGLFLAWEDMREGRFEGGALAGLLVAVVPLVCMMLVLFVVLTFLIDFVVPAMYLGRLPVGEAWRVVRREVLEGRAGTVALYLLMKVLISIVMGVVTFGLICGTLGVACCLLMIPYLGTVVLLPLLVFNRCYSLCFLEQLGGRWKLFAPPPAAEPGPA